jgi:hypothetical protein
MQYDDSKPASTACHAARRKRTSSITTTPRRTIAVRVFALTLLCGILPACSGEGLTSEPSAEGSEQLIAQNPIDSPIGDDPPAEVTPEGPEAAGAGDPCSQEVVDCVYSCYRRYRPGTAGERFCLKGCVTGYKACRGDVVIITDDIGAK